MYEWKDYVIEADGEPLDDSGETDVVEMGFKCPNCNATLPALADGGAQYCPTCDAYWRREGDKLVDADE